MKRLKIMMMVGFFFMGMQGSSLMLMMILSRAQQLPAEQTANALTVVIDVMLVSLILVGILFVLLLAGMVWRSWQQDTPGIKG